MRLPRLTLRMRLTLVYGGLFLLAGLVLLALTYFLVVQQIPRDMVVSGSKFGVSELGTPGFGDRPEAVQQTIQYIAADTWGKALKAMLTQGGLALVLDPNLPSAVG